VFKSDPPVQFLLKGEVFDPLMTAKLTAGAGLIAGAGAVHTDDQTFSATFNTQGQALGFWDTTVTNPNGLASTLVGSVLIDFQGGSVTMLDNLIRPLQGGKTKVTVTVYDGGTITVKLYTLSGRSVSTLVDSTLPAGTYTYQWDGTASSGQRVASGVYLVRVKGPKLDTTNKIVVIK
jgi:hypothetical protein